MSERVDLELKEVETFEGAILYRLHHPQRTHLLRGAVVKDEYGNEVRFRGRFFRRRSRAWVEIVHRADEFTVVRDANVVPVEIAALGKPAIAAYLDTLRLLSRSQIAEKLSVEERTVGQYVSRFRRGVR